MTSDNKPKEPTPPETENRKLYTHIMDLENQVRDERDFLKRLVQTISAVHRDESSAGVEAFLSHVRPMVTGDTDIQERDRLLTDTKNRLMQTALGTDKKAPQKVSRSVPQKPLAPPEKAPTQMDDIIPRLKTSAIEELSNLKVIIGENYRSDLGALWEKAENAQTVDDVIALKAPVTNIIESYIEDLLGENDRIIEFFRELSEKLVLVEKDIESSAAEADHYQKKALTISDNLHSEIKNVSARVHQSTQFDELKSFLVSHLETITTVLDKTRREYIDRLQKVETERENLRKHFEHVILRLTDENRSLEERSRKDPLTGIFNRRVLEEHMNAELERFMRYDKPFSVIFFDIDKFKEINDTYGHDAGDRALLGIAIRARDVIRKMDTFARYGGDEFVVILPETDSAKGFKVAEKLHHILDETVFEYEGQRVPIVLSIGVTAVQASDTSIETIVTRADKHMYLAKKSTPKVVGD